MTDNQTFRLLDPTGKEIMNGPMSVIMERLPDTHARNDALSTMLDTAVKQVEAEQRADEARASVARSLCDGLTRLATRLDSFEKQRAISAKRAEAARKEIADRRVQRYLDEMPDPDDPYSFDPAEQPADEDPEGIIPDPKDPTGAVLEDQEPQDPGQMGEVYTPEPHPDPGSRLYPPAPQVSQPTAISLNEA